MYQNHHRAIEELFTWLNTTCYGLDFQRLPSKQKANTDMGWGGGVEGRNNTNVINLGIMRKLSFIHLLKH